VNILIVCSGLGFGGAERQIVLLAREFVANGNRVSIFTLNRVLHRATELADVGVEVVANQKKSRLDWALIRSLRAFLKLSRPDVIHAFLYDADIFSRIAAVGLGVPVISSERSSNYYVSPIQRLGYIFAKKLAVALIANSESGAAFGACLHGRRPEDVYVVRNGIDLGEIDRRIQATSMPAHGYWPDQPTLRICMVGSISPAKDYPLALLTLQEALRANPRWRMICVGDARPEESPEYKNQIFKLVHDLELEDYVEFLGHRRDAIELIASSEVQLVTSVREGFPNVVLEAMASGTPVVTTDYSDVRQILPNAWQVISSRDPKDLARALERCVMERNAVAALQRRWVNEHGSIQASAVSILNVYRRYVSYKEKSNLISSFDDAL